MEIKIDFQLIFAIVVLAYVFEAKSLAQPDLLKTVKVKKGNLRVGFPTLKKAGE